MSEATTIRIKREFREILRELAENAGRSMQAVLEDAIKEYRRKRALEQLNSAFAALKADPEAWEEELAERAEWDVTLQDGLNDN